MKTRIELTSIDFVVLSLGFSISLAVGLYYAYKERNKLTPYRYHRGEGKLKAIPVALSFLVTFESSVFFLGYPAEVYVHGFTFWLYNVSIVIGYSSLLWISVPLFYRLQVTSIFEYLQMRYDSLVIRQVGMCVSCVYMIIYAGIVIFGAALAVESMTNIPSIGSMFILTTIAVIYTALGGLKAVVATDVIQGVIMIASIFAVLISGVIQVGGINNVIALTKPSGRLLMVDFDPNPLTRHTFWSILIGGTIRTFPMAFGQPAVQRINSTANISKARKVIYITITGFVVLTILVMVEGLVIFAYFSNKGCDPLASGQIENPNQVVPYAVLDMFQNAPGVAGLFLAAVCSASLSTISSLLSSVSAIVVEDFVKSKLPSASDRMLVYISKAIVVLCGVICTIVALIIGNVKGPMGEISGSILGALNGPLSAVFTLSIFVRFANRKGIIACAIAGMATAMWLSIGYNCSTGRKVTPWLPLGPTDSCPADGIDGNLTAQFVTMNTTLINHTLFRTTPHTPTNATFNDNTTHQDIRGLDILYSISYMYIGGMVLTVAIATGLIVSRLTMKRADVNAVPDHLVLSLPCCRKRKGFPNTSEEELSNKTLKEGDENTAT